MGARAVSMGARAVIPVIFNGCIILRKFQWVFCVRTYPRQARVVRMGEFSSESSVSSLVSSSSVSVFYHAQFMMGPVFYHAQFAMDFPNWRFLIGRFIFDVRISVLKCIDMEFVLKCT